MSTGYKLKGTDISELTVPVDATYRTISMASVFPTIDTGLDTNLTALSTVAKRHPMQPAGRTLVPGLAGPGLSINDSSVIDDMAFKGYKPRTPKGSILHGADPNTLIASGASSIGAGRTFFIYSDWHSVKIYKASGYYPPNYSGSVVASSLFATIGFPVGDVPKMVHLLFCGGGGGGAGGHWWWWYNSADGGGGGGAGQVLVTIPIGLNVTLAIGGGGRLGGHEVNGTSGGHSYLYTGPRGGPNPILAAAYGGGGGRQDRVMGGGGGYSGQSPYLKKGFNGIAGHYYGNLNTDWPFLVPGSLPEDINFTLQTRPTIVSAQNTVGGNSIGPGGYSINTNGYLGGGGPGTEALYIAAFEAQNTGGNGGAGAFFMYY